MAELKKDENISALSISVNAPAVKRLKTSANSEATTLLTTDNKTRKNKVLKPGNFLTSLCERQSFV